MKKIIITLIFLFSFIPFINAKEVNLYLFYSNSCPHCAHEKEFLVTIDNIKIKKYEVSQYSKLYDKVVDKLVNKNVKLKFWGDYNEKENFNS